MGPVRLDERFEVMDAVRGLALFGIIASNMRAFNGPLAAYLDHSLMWTDSSSRHAQAVIDVLISGKFITIFSFLFGMGFAIQMDRAQARGLAGRGFYLRRLSVLMAFGLLHAIFLWWGDILFPYAFMGFGLYLFRNRRPRTILAWAAFLYCWPLLLTALMLAVQLAGIPIPSPPRTTPAEIARLVQVHATGTYGAIFVERMKDMVFNTFALILYYPRILGIFLAGLWVWRTGIVRNLEAQQARLRYWQHLGLVFGLPLNLAMVAIGEIWHPDPMATSVSGSCYLLAGSLGMPLLSLFYATTVARWFLDPVKREWLHGFSAVGRTALTNYLLQTVICTTLFYGYGLGWYGRVAPLPGFLLSVVIYAAQVPLSLWITRRFAFGPMEWLWRRLTYGSAMAAR